MKKKIFYIVTLVCITLIGLNGCKTKQQVAQKTTIQKGKNKIEQIIEAQPKFESARATNAKVVLEYQNRKITANADINISKDEAIKISVKVFGMELAIAEMNKQEITLIDKLNQRYVKTTFAEVQYLTKMPISFNDIQSILTEQLFAIGRKQDEINKLKPIIQIGTDTTIIDFESYMKHIFKADNATNHIVQTQILTNSGKNSLTLDYANLQTKNSIDFPHTITVQAKTSNTQLKATITINKLEFNNGAITTPTDTSKLTKVTLQTIIPGLK